MWLMIIKHFFFTRFSTRDLRSEQIYLVNIFSYHFIKMLNRPVDLPLRFIVVCVAETLTLNRQTYISTKLHTDMAQ